MIRLGPSCPDRLGDPFTLPLLVELGEPADGLSPRGCEDSRFDATSAAMFEGRADSGTDRDDADGISSDPAPVAAFAERGVELNRLRTRLAASTSAWEGSNPSVCAGSAAELTKHGALLTSSYDISSSSSPPSVPSVVELEEEFLRLKTPSPPRAGGTFLPLSSAPVLQHVMARLTPFQGPICPKSPDG